MDRTAAAGSVTWPDAHFAVPVGKIVVADGAYFRRIWPYPAAARPTDICPPSAVLLFFRPCCPAVTIVTAVSMAMELARFTVLDGSEGQLLAERPAMVEALHQRFPGCMAAYLTKEDDGSWLDVLVWSSRAEAEDAAQMIT